MQQDALPAHSRMFPPAADLRAIVEGCWLFSPQDAVPGTLAFSDGIPALVFYLDEQQRVQSGWCSAQLLQNIHLHPAPGALLVLRFTGTGFYRLAPDKVPVLRHQPVWSFEEVFGENWMSKLQAAKDVEMMIETLQNLVRETAARHEPSVPPLLEAALAVIRKAKGNLSIESLSDSLKVNYKWLERKFISITGISPKEHARLQRFLHAYFHLLQTGGRDLMGTAVLNGYYDQNHFTKEFRLFTGKPPGAYLSGKSSYFPHSQIINTFA